MNSGNFINSINKYDFELFKIEYLSQNLDEKSRQTLLVRLFENDYNYEQFNFYKLIFDLIIDENLNLNFKTNIGWSNTFLNFVISTNPNIELLDYFITKNADINYFIKDRHESNNETSLDFANKKFYDAVEDNQLLYFSEINPNYESFKNNKICIDKVNYSELLERSNYLKDIFDTYKIINHIMDLGGKTYEELKKL